MLFLHRQLCLGIYTSGAHHYYDSMCPFLIPSISIMIYIERALYTHQQKRYHVSENFLKDNKKENNGTHAFTLQNCNMERVH